MKNRITYWIIFITLAFMPSFLFAQFSLDPKVLENDFSLLNPAGTGANKYNNLEAGMYYLRQWVGVESPAMVAAFNLHGRIPERGHFTVRGLVNKKLYRTGKIGLGLRVISDRFDPSRKTSLLASYAYHMETSKYQISGGIAAGFKQLLVDYYQLHPAEFDPILAAGEEKEMSPVFGVGFHFISKKFNGSIAFNENLPIQPSGSEELFRKSRGYLEMMAAMEWKQKISKTTESKLGGIFLTNAMKKPVMDFYGRISLKEKITFGINLAPDLSRMGFYGGITFQRISAGYGYDQFVLSPVSSMRAMHTLNLAVVIL